MAARRVQMWATKTLYHLRDQDTRALGNEISCQKLSVEKRKWFDFALSQVLDQVPPVLPGKR
jgi:hypothetical protein